MKSHSLSIILRRIAYGESDWVVNFLTRDRGRMAGFAKSARSSLKRFGGALEPGTLSELQFTESDPSKMPRLDSAVVFRPVTGIAKSLERISAMTRALELGLKFLQENEQAPEKFDLLEAYLSFISENQPDAWDVLTFELQWLTVCGFRPVLKKCPLCGKTHAAGNSVSFDLSDGGVLCSSCSGKARAPLWLSAEALEGLVEIDSGRRDAPSNSAKEAIQVITRYVDHVAGKRLVTNALDAV